MPKDKKQSSRNYYKEHSDIWKKNYEKNAPARRERARSYAEDQWNGDPEYKKKHKAAVIERTRIVRYANSITKYATKILGIFEKLV